MSNNTLKEKTVNGAGWSAIDNVAQLGVSFVVSIVLARLLSPDDYGLLGIVAIFTNICATIINGGFGSALIRKKDTTENDYNTVFIVNLVASFILYALLFFLAPLFAIFFGRSELVSLTQVSSIGIIIGSLAIVQQARLTKEIDFKTQTYITIISSLISGVVGIVIALCDYGVWSLVWQGLISQILKTLLLWYFKRWRPVFQFSLESFKELFGFGWKLMVGRLIDTVWKELNQFVVGKYYNPATLGQYTRANQFSQLFSINLTTVVDRVTFPVLSEIQDDNERMLNAYRRIIKITMFIAAVCMFALAAISEPLIYCLIGPKWHEASEYLPLICIAGSLFPLSAINLNMLAVQGRSDLFLGLEVVKKIISLCPLFIGAFIGITPMLYTNIIVFFLCYLLNSYYSGKILGYSSWMQIKDIAPSYLVAIVVAFSVYFFKYLPISNWVILPLQIITGTMVFLLFCKKTKLEEYDGLKQLVLPYLKRIIKR